MSPLQQCTISGLNSEVHKVMTAGVYSMYASATELPPSGLVITLSQSGSTSVSFVSPTTGPIQGSVQVNGKFNCQVGDLLTCAVTSSASGDHSPNMIKTQCVLKLGI